MITKTEQEKRQNRYCFTGHRPEKLHCSEIEVKTMLVKEIATALKQGKRTFISGMARESDIFAAELVLEYRAQYPDIHLICALPHPDFEKYWSSEWQQRYHRILMAADLVKVICPVFSMSSYQIRNEWMVDHSSLLIAVYNGKAGGTRNTIEYANNQESTHSSHVYACCYSKGIIKKIEVQVCDSVKR